MYFMDPAGICEGGVKTDQLVFQEGSSYTDTANLVRAPHKWEDAQNDNWVDQKYFLGMGHHITPYEVGQNKESISYKTRLNFPRLSADLIPYYYLLKD